MNKDRTTAKITKVRPGTVNDVDGTLAPSKKTFLRRGAGYWISDPTTVEHLDVLPAANYIIKRSLFGEYFLEKVEDFDVPPRIYGDSLDTVNRILHTYKQRSNNTGVLLSGEKGAGKTLTGKLISVEAAKQGIPTLLINEPLGGEDFNNFIQSISQLCILFFDEFEKVYDGGREDAPTQEALLTLLDGVFTTQKLMVFTSNDKYGVDKHMLNRPGRIFYAIDYRGLEAQFIREYCDDNLDDKNHTEGVVNVASLFYAFNFDILKALVEEMNRFKETPVQAMKYLNAKPDGDNTSAEHDAELFVDGTLIDDVYNDSIHGNPMKMQKFSMTQYFEAKRGKKAKENVIHTFDFDDLVSMNVKKGEYIFTKKNATLKLKRKEYKSFDLALGYDAATFAASEGAGA